jgi:RNA polymerase sigma-70 factor (ECF subfamily)
MMDFDAPHPDSKRLCRDSSSGPESGRPRRGAIDKSLHGQIETLIPRLRRYALAMARDSVAADDLVQDCLTRALGKIHLWEKGTNLRAWLFTILHNQHISLARRAARQRDIIELQKCKRGLAPSPSQMVRLELRDLERAIARLPEEQRSLILLVGLEGMRYDEVASVVNLPIGTVRSRISRGREALRIMTGLSPSRHSRPPRIGAHLVAPRRQVPSGNHSQSRSLEMSH